MKNNFSFTALVVILLYGFTIPSLLHGQIRHEVFLPNTDHELNVYRISGDEPGKTLMIIGGIQGDEPGSYITADLYADIHLKKGNLIVVPRANLFSILLSKREGLTGDMNRKFTADTGNKKQTLEEEIVSILKHLIAESDLLLNLHEGSGFYNPEWINDMENPMRYGQSVIFDTARIEDPSSGKIIDLETMANRIIGEVNKQIQNKRYHFRPNNHNTSAENSKHKEQRKSATYYALTKAHIPAFGIETSKTIKLLSTKVNLHKLVINGVMQEMGIEFDTPGVVVDPPELEYLLIRVNDGYPYAMPHGSTLQVEMDDEVVITDIIGNYPRGLVADVSNFGSANDMNRSFRVSDLTRVIVRKDAEQCGWVELMPKQKSPELVATEQTPKREIQLSELRAQKLLIDVNGKVINMINNETLSVKRGSRITLQGIRTNIAKLDKDIIVNFKGFAPPKAINDGDDLFFPIYTNQDLWKRYSVGKKGNKYPIVSTYKDKEIGKFYIELQ